MAKLSVNINKIATLRNTRTNGIPDLLRLAKLCLDAGAHGITVHPRPDQRHIRPDDVVHLARMLSARAGIEFNIEGNPFDNFLPHIEAARPAQCTLVPDSRDVPTSNQGWNLTPANCERLKPMIEKLKNLGSRVSLFIDPVPRQIEQAAKLNVDRVELYTEPYAEAYAAGDPHATDLYVKAAIVARDHGLGVNAGHDLNLKNLPALIEAIPFLAEVSIGHALIADALEFGIVQTVKRYLKASQIASNQ